MADEMSDDERIMLPRLGAHLRLWGSGHSCESASPHEGPCICECGVPAPYERLAEPGEREAWEQCWQRRVWFRLIRTRWLFWPSARA